MYESLGYNQTRSERGKNVSLFSVLTSSGMHWFSVLTSSGMHWFMQSSGTFVSLIVQNNSAQRITKTKTQQSKISQHLHCVLLRRVYSPVHPQYPT